MYHLQYSNFPPPRKNGSSGPSAADNEDGLDDTTRSSLASASEHLLKVCNGVGVPVVSCELSASSGIRFRLFRVKVRVGFASIALQDWRQEAIVHHCVLGCCQSEEESRVALREQNPTQWRPQ